MNIAFLCRWKIDDGLTVSTVMPHLQALLGFKQIDKIIFITLEDEVKAPADATVNTVLSDPKIAWTPFRSATYKSKMLNQIADYTRGYNKLNQLVKEKAIDLVIAHGAPAGAVADKACTGTAIPYLVTLFEPHADYMLESGVWSRFGLKYRMQKYWESCQKERAAALMPVTEAYKLKLIAEGVPHEKIAVVPCSVEALYFKFDEQKRREVRERLNWKNTLIGIYVGKFGGLYYNDEAYQLYRQCFDQVPGFRLIILSPQPKQEIEQQLRKYKIDLNDMFVTAAQHTEVAGYLSAADFAFATYKSGPSKRYLSPVKIGEYWANGLPVLLTEGVGDDSEIIRKEGGGALFDLEEEGSTERALQQLLTIIKDPAHRQQIPALAAKYRSPDRIREAYAYFFSRKNA